MKPNNTKPQPDSMKKNIETFYHVLHKNCEGRIVLISNNKEVLLCCMACKETWDIKIESPFMNHEQKMKLGDDMYIQG